MGKCILSSCVQSTRPIDCTVSLCPEISRNTIFCRYRARYPRIKYYFTRRYRLAYYITTIVGCENIEISSIYQYVAPDSYFYVHMCTYVYLYILRILFTYILLRKTGTRLKLEVPVYNPNKF